jgi:hypothetical protein
LGLGFGVSAGLKWSKKGYNGLNWVKGYEKSKRLRKSKRCRLEGKFEQSNKDEINHYQDYCNDGYSRDGGRELSVRFFLPWLISVGSFLSPSSGFCSLTFLGPFAVFHCGGRHAFCSTRFVG